METKEKWPKMGKTVGQTSTSTREHTEKQQRPLGKYTRQPCVPCGCFPCELFQCFHLLYLGGTRHYCSGKSHVWINTTSVLCWPYSFIDQLHTNFMFYGNIQWIHDNQDNGRKLIYIELLVCAKIKLDPAHTLSP